MGCAMSEEHTTAVVQRYLDELESGSTSASRAIAARVC